jgi:hypothetical protein
MWQHPLLASIPVHSCKECMPWDRHLTHEIVEVLSAPLAHGPVVADLESALVPCVPAAGASLTGCEADEHVAGLQRERATRGMVREACMRKYLLSGEDQLGLTAVVGPA